MLALFRLLSRPYLVRHAGRTLLALVGIAMAVGVYASMHLANAAIRDAFFATTDRLAGSAHLYVSGTDIGVPETALEAAQSPGCVEAATALVVRTVSLPNKARLAVLGIDLLDEPRFREYHMDGSAAEGIDDALVFLAQPDSVLVTREFAAGNRLRHGESFPVWTGSETRALRIRGFLQNTGAVRAYGGAVAVMDLYAAQHTFGTRGLFDRIDVRVREGQDLDRCRAEIARAAGGGLKVEPPPSRGNVETFSKTYLLLVESSGLLGMLIAMFLVHHAGATAVAQREPEIAILLGLGADERKLSQLVLLENALNGALGAALGIASGALGAGRLGAALAGLVESGFGTSLTVGRAPIEWRWALATILATGVLCGLAALGPARSAAAVPPIQLAEAGRFSPLADRGRRRALLAAACCLSAVLLQVLDGRAEMLYLTLPAAAIGLALGAGALSAGAFRAIRPLFARAWPLEGSLAMDSLIRSNRRTRGAIAGLSLTAAAVLAISGITAGYSHELIRFTRQLVNGDYLIHSSPNLASRGQVFPWEVVRRLEAIPGVEDVIPLRRFYGEADHRRARLMATDLRRWSRRAGILGGSPEKGAVISRNFANRAGRRVGDSIRIPAPGGTLVLPVSAILDEYSSETGSVYFDWRFYKSHFREDAVEMVSVYVAPDAAREPVRRAMLECFDPSAPVLILDAGEFRAQLAQTVARWRGVSAVQIMVALLLSLVGVGGLLAVSVAVRRREFALLHVLGATPAQVGRCVLVEALGVAGAGLLIGAVLGAALQGFLLFALRHSVNGFELPWRVDLRMAAALFAAVPAGALLAAILPLASLRAQGIESDG